MKVHLSVIQSCKIRLKIESQSLEASWECESSHQQDGEDNEGSRGSEIHHFATGANALEQADIGHDPSSRK